MLHRRPTIIIATSALLFLCVAFHAQTGAASQRAVPYGEADAYKTSQSHLPTDWTGTIAHAQRLLIEIQTGTMGFWLKPDRESTGFLQPCFGYLNYRHGRLCGGDTSQILEKKDGVWKNLPWKGTSCAWAS